MRMGKDPQNPLGCIKLPKNTSLCAAHPTAPGSGRVGGSRKVQNAVDDITAQLGFGVGPVTRGVANGGFGRNNDVHEGIRGAVQRKGKAIGCRIHPGIDEIQRPNQRVVDDTDGDLNVRGETPFRRDPHRPFHRCGADPDLLLQIAHRYFHHAPPRGN